MSTPLTLFGPWNGTGDVRRHFREVHAEPVEEHHRGVDAGGPGNDDAPAEPLEVGGVEPCQVEARLFVKGRAAAGSRPRLRGHAEVHIGPGEVALELLPAPQADEVVAAGDEELEVGVIVEALRLGRAVTALAQAVLEVVVEVGAGQEDDVTVASHCEVARVVGRHDERARRRDATAVMRVHGPSVRLRCRCCQSEDPGRSSARRRGGAGGGRRTGGRRASRGSWCRTCRRSP